MSQAVLSLVQDTFDHCVGYKGPLELPAKYVDAAMEVFSRLAIESLPEKKVNATQEGLDSETIDKVVGFVEAYALNFRWLCESNFPFSRLEDPTCQEGLESYIKNSNSAVAQLMVREEWKSVDKERSFQEAFQSLDPEMVKQTCIGLLEAYSRRGSHNFGYDLLWVIKQWVGADFEIPPIESFGDTTMQRVFSDFFVSEKGEFSFSLAEIFYSRVAIGAQTPFLYQGLFLLAASNKFLQLTLIKLRETPLDEWPKKKDVIVPFLESISSGTRVDSVRYLTTSSDEWTAEVSSHILAALEGTSFNEQIPHFHKLMDLLPSFTSSVIERIFFRPFKPFIARGADDPSFVRRLSFNGGDRVFVHGDLMVGAYSLDNRISPYLLAYDMKTEKMEWGISLHALGNESKPCHLNRAGDCIVLQFFGKSQVHLVDLKNGKVTSTVELPYPSEKSSRLHLTSDQFGYQMVEVEGERRLIGGKIVDSKLDPSFQKEAAGGYFTPLSTHVGFFSHFDSKLVIVSPTGDQVAIDCFSCYAKGDKLYLIEENSSNETTCVLTVRTLTTDEKVVSFVEKRVVLKTISARIKELCENGEMILFDGNEQPIFLDLRQGRKPLPVYQGKIKAFSLSTEWVVNSELGEIWNWSSISEKVFQITPKEAKVCSQRVEGSKETKLLHCQDGKLYLSDFRRH